MQSSVGGRRKADSTVLNWSGKSLPTEWYAHPSKAIFTNGSATGDTTSQDRLICGDNLPILLDLLKTHRGRVDLIYIDPPFDSKANYVKKVRLKGSTTKPLKHEQLQYQDRWTGDSYLQFMYERLRVMHELLSEQGSIIIHCDRHRAHHLRCIADEVFGGDQFRGSMAWCYGGGGAPKRQYPSKHDTLLWFSKSNQWTFNKQFRPYSKSTLARGLTKVKGPKYALHEQGAMLNDWWADDAVQKILSPTAFENLKYPTQKPEALLKRIIIGHSNPGDVVLDCFTGSGTTLAVARANHRHYIGIDQNPGAIATTLHRLLNQDRVHANKNQEPLRSFELHCTQAYIEMMSAPNRASIDVSRSSTHIEIRHFHPKSLVEKLREAEIIIDHPNLLIESVMIDPHFDGNIFRPSMVDIPGRKEIIKAKYLLPANSSTVHIWVTDILSNVHRMTLERPAS
jgi:adenine specific DNA methylase Mod